MAEITAAQVKNLREKTGLPMMECKAALIEAEGDEQKAIDLLRKKGAEVAAKKAGRETAEGRIGCFVDPERGVAALAELRCEPAPVANTDYFKNLAGNLARQVALASGPVTAESLLDQPLVDDPQRTARALMEDAFNRLRENMTLVRVTKLEGEGVGGYVHFNGRVGAIVAVRPARTDAELLSDLCMHITAMNPMVVHRDQVAPAIVDKERQIAREQAAQSGKPENIIEKIVAGKLERWFADHVLLEQAYIRDEKGKKTVGDVLREAGGIEVLGFVRFELGETPADAGQET